MVREAEFACRIDQELRRRAVARLSGGQGTPVVTRVVRIRSGLRGARITITGVPDALLPLLQRSAW